MYAFFPAGRRGTACAQVVLSPGIIGAGVFRRSRYTLVIVLEPPAKSPRDDGRVPGAPTSKLAITALVMTCVPCCSPVTMVGVVIATIAALRIRSADGKLGGIRLARAAVLIGVGQTLIMLFVLGQVRNSLSTQVNRDADQLVNDLFSDDAATRSGVRWARTVAVSDEAIMAFIRQAESRYGAFQSFTVVRHSFRPQGMFDQAVDVGGTFVFEDARRPGGAVLFFDIEMPASRSTLTLRSVEIADATIGALHLPPEDHVEDAESGMDDAGADAAAAAGTRTDGSVR